jgi:hypothetical protein
LSTASNDFLASRGISLLIGHLRTHPCPTPCTASRTGGTPARAARVLCACRLDEVPAGDYRFLTG